MNKIARTPKLRFPEFSGEWNTQKLIDSVLGHNSGIYKDKKLYGSGKNIAGVSNLYDINFIDGQEFNKVSLTGEEIEKYSLKEGDMLYGESSLVRSGIAKTLYVTKKGEGTCFAWHTRRYKVDANTISPSFLYYEINSSSCRKSIESVATQTALTGITTKDYFNIDVYLPSLLEQNKIASFLSSIDTKIEQLSKKKTLIELYKKGLMQQIFSQKIRFQADDGSDYPDWEYKKYGDIYTFHSTNSLSRDKLNYKNGFVKNIHYGDIHTKFSTIFDITKEEVPFINSELDLSKIKEDNYCLVGDLVVADASEDYLDIGKTIEIVNLNNEKVTAGLHTFLARPDKHEMALGFSGYLLKSWKVRKQVMIIAQGAKVLGLSTKRLAGVVLSVPSFPEQTKIANFLSSIDTKIEQVSNQLEQTKRFKKALLQQVFL